MRDLSRFLLRTDSQMAEFRRRYRSHLAAQGEAYVAWVSSWPAREWRDFLAGVPEANIPAVIGTLCTLIADGRLDAGFNETATLLRRNWTDEEFAALFTVRGIQEKGRGR